MARFFFLNEVELISNHDYTVFYIINVNKETYKEILTFFLTEAEVAHGGPNAVCEVAQLWESVYCAPRIATRTKLISIIITIYNFQQILTHLAIFFRAKRLTYLSEADHFGSIPNPTTFTPGILDNRPPTINIPISNHFTNYMY